MPRIYKNTYFQGTLSDDTCKLVLDLLQEKEISSLRNSIYNLPDDVVNDIINYYETGDCELPNISGYIGCLKPEQTVAVAFLYYVGSALIGDSVGLGKTVEIAALCNLLTGEYDKESFRYCFLTKDSALAHQIRQKLVKFTGDYVYLVEDAEKKNVDKYFKYIEKNGVCSIVGTHSLLNNSDFLVRTAKKPFDLFVIDESKILRNTGTATYDNAKALLKYHNRKVFLNATPIETHIRDFYNQMVLLDKDYMPNVTEFENSFCTKTKQGRFFKVTGVKNVEVLKQALTFRYLARKRKDLGAQYTGNKIETWCLACSPVQKALYRKTSLHQLVSDYPCDVDLSLSFDVEVVPKARAVLEIINMYESYESIMIYCHYRKCQDALQELLVSQGYTVSILNGGTPVNQRKLIVSDFNNGGSKILITNVTHGLDLKNCNVAILYSINPNPQNSVQVEGRITRDFDICYKHLYLLVMQGKEESNLKGVISNRIKLSDKVLGNDKSLVLDAIEDMDKWKYVNYYL